MARWLGSRFQGIIQMARWLVSRFPRYIIQMARWLGSRFQGIIQMARWLVSRYLSRSSITGSRFFDCFDHACEHL